MVFKKRLVIYVLILTILTILAFTVKGRIEAGLLKTLLPQSITNSNYIIPLTDKTASNIRVVFESTGGNANVSGLKDEFINKIDKNYFEIVEYDTKGLVNEYLNSPTNFLSTKMREKLKAKKYDEIFNERFAALIDPAGIQLSPLDKDPYLVLDDFLLSNRHEVFGINEFDNKIYDYITLKIKNEEGLSPDLCNKKISELIKYEKELSQKENKIYLAGTPVHSYYTSQKAVFNVNVICILSTLMVVFLTYFFFRKIKILFPVGLAIICGMLAGYVATKIWFDDFQIITMVFSMTLIGIGIDYSYHYFFSKYSDRVFVKNLSLSLVTTIVPFLLLYITGIELLKQISVFIVFGLIAIYLTVIFIYPVFSKTEPVKDILLRDKWIKNTLIVLFVLSFIGFFRADFNDSLNSLYTPPKKLTKAEELYNKVSGQNFSEIQYVVVKGKSIKDIIEKEEKITSELDGKGIAYTAISSFLPSEIKQKENYELVKELYKSNLSKYSAILSPIQIQRLKTAEFNYININPERYTFFNNFMLDKKTSVIFVFTDKKLSFDNSFNIKSDIQKYLRTYRIKLLKILIPVFCILVIILSVSFGFKNGVKLILPSVCGMIGATGLSLLINDGLNVFSIIALFMVLGFTMDYSIFRFAKESQTENAVFASCITTTFAFLLLSCCGFKMLSSISEILFFGILISYLSGYLIYKNKD